MPLTILNQHRFGIISQRQRLELQNRLLCESEENKTNKNVCHKNPFKITEEFIDKYNKSNEEDQIKMKEQVIKMIEFTKKRCGLSSNGEGLHVDAALAWSELVYIIQCEGCAESECIQILLVSLNNSPLLEKNIKTLFFLAECVIFWIDVEHQGKKFYLKNYLINIIRMGELVFLRLLYHFFMSHLNNYSNSRSSLKIYIKDLQKKQNLFSSHPDLETSIRLMSKIGEMISFQTQKSTEIPKSVLKALNIWKISGSKDKQDLKGCFKELYDDLKWDNWLESIITISIIGEAAKKDVKVCKLFFLFARGVVDDSKNVDGNDLKIKKNNFLGVQRWNWIVSCQYIRILKEIIICSSSIKSQKIALLGKWHDVDVTSFRTGFANLCQESCSLVDLVEFKRIYQDSTAKDDWKVRFAAFFAISFLSRFLLQIPRLKCQQIACSILSNTIQESVLMQPEVTKAFIESQKELNRSEISSKVNIWSRISENLSKIFSHQKPEERKEDEKKKMETKKQTHIIPSTSYPIKRPTIRQEVMMSKPKPQVVNWSGRCNRDLQLMMADQLRKDIACFQEIEKLNLIVEEERVGREQEEKRLKIEESRKLKLKGRQTVDWKPYQIASSNTTDI